MLNVPKLKASAGSGWKTQAAAMAHSAAKNFFIGSLSFLRAIEEG